MGAETILARVRAALAETARPELPPAAAAPAPAATAILAREFTVAAESVGTRVHHAATAAAAAALVADTIRAGAARRLVVWDGPLSRAVVPVALTSLPNVAATTLGPAVDPADVATADVGVTEADALIAASGTVLVGSAAWRHRAASLLPPVHIVLARKDALVADLATALHRTDPGGGACRTLITGPSRTADIEKKLVVGVHGPCTLHVILIGPD